MSHSLLTLRFPTILQTNQKISSPDKLLPEKQPLLSTKITLNGSEIQENKPIPNNLNQEQFAHSRVLNEANFQNWEFSKLNILFGTDSQPFTCFINQQGKAKCLGMKSNMSLKNHQAVVRLDDERLIFAGGVNYLFNHVTSKTFEYNIRNSKYTKMPNLMNRRFFAQSVFSRGRLLVIGGRDYGNDSVAIMRSCEEYDFGKQKWEEIGNLNFARCNFTSIIFKSDIYVFSGLSKTSSLLNSIEKFNFQKSSWEILGLEVTQDMLGNLGFHKGDEIIIFGGTRAWGAGAIIRLNLKYGADLGEAVYQRMSCKNALAKPIVLNQHVIVSGGFFPNAIIIDRRTLKISNDSGVNGMYKEVLDHIDRLCLQSFRLTKCSFVLPCDNLGGKL